MNLTEVIEILRRDNPDAREQNVRTYAQSFIEYTEAVENLQRLGTVCAHPRTGQPMPNPYADVKRRALGEMQKVKGLNTDPLWKQHELEGAEEL